MHFPVHNGYSYNFLLYFSPISIEKLVPFITLFTQ